MSTETPEKAAFVTDPAAEAETTNVDCRVCRDFGSENCDVLLELGHYRQTEDAVLEAVAREKRPERS